MERKRVKEEDSDEEMYFEMDFTPSDEINSEDELDDSSSLSDTQDDISISQDYQQSRHRFYAAAVTIFLFVPLL
jgi:hypothetical protein